MTHRKLSGLFRFHRFKRKVSAISVFLVLTVLVLFLHDFISVLPDNQVKRRFHTLEHSVVRWAKNTAHHAVREYFTQPPKSVRDLVNATVMNSDLSESLKRRIILVLTENNLTSTSDDWRKVNISSLHRNLPSLVNLTLSCVEGQDVSKCDTSRVTQLFMMNTESLAQEKPVNSTKKPKVILNPGPVNPMTGESLVLPGAIIIGAKKCGTRALLEYLRIHPNVSAVGPELHFFDKKYQKGLQWYSDQMPKGQPGWLFIEKTPSYFVTKEAPARVYYMNPKVSLLVVVRDPVTRAISDYAQAKSKKPGLKSFEEFSFTSSKPSVVSTTWPPIRLGVYAKYLERWLNYFPMSQFHFVSGEGLIQDPAHEMEKVQDFLRLSRYITDKHFYFNATKGFPCLVPEKNLPPKCLGKTKGRHHPAINQTVYNRLRDFYRPFNQKFYTMTGIDFGWP